MIAKPLGPVPRRRGGKLRNADTNQAEFFRQQMRSFLAAASMAQTRRDADAYHQMAKQCEFQLSRIAAAT